MLDQNYGIVVRNLVKRYQTKRLLPQRETLKGYLLRGLRGGFWRRDEEVTITALSGITFSVQRGQTLGIIGSNGSGKSTLLKILAGFILPTSGQVRINGRASALIELGTGFHPEISGRENIVINAAILGLSRSEIEAKMDDIIRFAELEAVIDLPVKTYSSGMYMRLGFSVAVHLDPEVLLIDEVLAVGDESFVQKGLTRIAEFKRQGRTIVLVTHDLSMVERFCDTAMWIDKGAVRQTGFPRKVIDAYLQHIHAEEDRRFQQVHDAAEAAHRVKVMETMTAAGQDTLSSAVPTLSGTNQDPDHPTERWGTRDLQFLSIRCLDGEGKERYGYVPDEAMEIEMTWLAHRDLGDIAFGIGLYTGADVLAFGTNTTIDRVPVYVNIGVGTIRFRIERLMLVHGIYHLDCASHTHDGLPFDYVRRLHAITIHATHGAHGVYAPDHSWVTGVAATSAERMAHVPDAADHL